MNGVWPWSPQTIMFSGYDVPQNDNADFYVKHQRAVTAYQEDLNIKLVQKKPFAPKTIVCCDDRVYSTRGTPLHEFLLELENKRDICLTVTAAYRLIALLHREGFYHLDAKVNNMIVVKGHRKDGINVTLPFADVHLCFVDFETLWAPVSLLSPDDVDIFNEGSDSLSMFGWKHHCHYNTVEHAYRYDVHTFSESMRSLYFQKDERFGEILTAHARVLGHIPEGVYGEDIAGGKRSFTEYLLDPSLPVLRPEEAITVVQVAFFPNKILGVKWRSTPCSCTDTEYCIGCVDEANAALNNLCPFAVPDIVGERDPDVRQTLEVCLGLCDNNQAELARALEYLGARPGDVARLLGVLND